MLYNWSGFFILISLDEAQNLVFMNFLRSLIIISLCVVTDFYSQNSITGYVSMENPDAWESEIHLSKLNLENHTNAKNSILIASSPIDKNGYFSFETKHLDEQNQLYRLHLNPISKEQNEELSENLKNYQLFILSKKDSIYFEKGESLFGNYTTNSKAHREWKQFRYYQSRFDTLTSIEDTEAYLLQTRGYVKDSLHILLVKLLGIKKLDEKNLLEKDINENTTYYTDFLDELRSSDLDPKLFLFLENKLLTVTGKITKQKYLTSKVLNILAFISIATLSFLLYRSIRSAKKPIPIQLSKQETIIRDLIVSGKTNKEIADTLYISLSTVKTHISNIYSKLNISNRKELLR